MAGLTAQFGSGFSDSTQVPSSESATAYSLLDGAGRSGLVSSSSTVSGNIAWQVTGVPVTSPGAEREVTAMLGQVAQLPGVEHVTSPYSAAGLAFRSGLIALTGALTSLGSILAGLGAITAIFQFGWGSALFGVGSAAPISFIIPVCIIGVVFGLSTDYQVFLVSRIREEWQRTGDNAGAIRQGVAETARVIVMAMAIMACVFGCSGSAASGSWPRSASAWPSPSSSTPWRSG